LTVEARAGHDRVVGQARIAPSGVGKPWKRKDMSIVTRCVEAVLELYRVVIRIRMTFFGPPIIALFLGES
jgi:hypothetical protein